METGSSPPLARFAERRIARHGLRPRVAASIIAMLWLVAIVAFGIVVHLVDRDAFETIGDGMWWAAQTVTTVGYGDVVPTAGAGRIIAGLLMIGGLSLFAVITGVITSEFVARAQHGENRRQVEGLEKRLASMADELAEIRRLLSQEDRGT